MAGRNDHSGNQCLSWECVSGVNENAPIVHRLAEALDGFLRTQIDVLVLGNYLVEKQ